MNFWEKLGLAVLVVAFLITFGDLLYDLSLYLRGLETESGHIWEHLRAWRAAGYPIREFPWLAILLPLGVGMQAVGLTIHLFAGLLKR